jgi:Flp pilus assembly protein TadB
MAALAWVLVAVAVMIAPPATPRPSTAAPVRRPMSPRTLQLVTAAAVAVSGIVLLGPTHGVVASAVAAPAAAWGVGRLAARKPAPPTDRALALTLDLIAVALRGGQPVPAALLLAAPAAGDRLAASLTQVAGLLRLGAEPAEAWRAVADDRALGQLAQVACRSSTSGIRLAGGLEQLADDLRAEFRALAEARAQRAGVIAMAPLGLCFLPAFVCLGVIPVIIGIAKGSLAAVQ